MTCAADAKVFHFGCKCGEVQKVIIDRLDDAPTLVCKACGRVTDPDTEPYRALLKKLREENKDKPSAK